MKENLKITKALLGAILKLLEGAKKVITPRIVTAGKDLAEAQKTLRDIRKLEALTKPASDATTKAYDLIYLPALEAYEQAKHDTQLGALGAASIAGIGAGAYTIRPPKSGTTLQTTAVTPIAPKSTTVTPATSQSTTTQVVPLAPAPVVRQIVNPWGTITFKNGGLLYRNAAGLVKQTK